MQVAIVGGGVLGLTLAHRLSARGHRVTLLEAEPRLGGLACAHDYGRFTWDRFYHCILPQDSATLGLVRELGLEASLRWSRTGTGYYGDGRMFDMNGNADFARFPLLSLVDKARLGAAVVWATRFADPWRLYRVTAEAWLTRLCGRHGYEVFWQPLLRAKFGPFHDRVAAVFIWATLKRLFAARSAGTASEKLGYVEGGYAAIVGRLAERLASRGAEVHTSARVTALRRTGDGACEVAWEQDGAPRSRTFDQVLWTAPTALAMKAASPELQPHLEATARDYPTSATYLGVACLVLALKKPLTRWYVLNLGDSSIPLTGVIEMTNLVARDQTDGLSLVYLPRYLASDDPTFDLPDDAIAEPMLAKGIERLFPSFDRRDIVYQGVHRARLVQPLPLVRPHGGGRDGDVPGVERPLQVLNTSMLACATLNNDEVIALVDRFVASNAAAFA